MTASPSADRSMPAGKLTFLFTDIEGSTSLWERHPEAMNAALARHDTLLRHAIEAAAGRVVKTTGDGVVAVFDEPVQALAACLAAQRSLQLREVRSANAGPAAPDLPAPITLKVRMGLHTGDAERRDGDYFGTSLIRAARIMSAAHGEQVLVSAATAEHLSARLPEGVVLREMGEHRLKGLRNAERLLQVVAADLRSEFPPLAALTEHSLPAERDAFVGRVEGLAELQRRLGAGVRLVCVLGLGGTGKTRLVTRFGWNALGEFGGGVWFCDLSGARSVDGIVQAVAQGLRLTLGNDDAVVQIGNAIAGRGRCLVILDNFEQVARHAEATLGAWLDRAADARFVVTSRERLGLPGEEVLALAPLSPADAATLFVCRAESAKPGFEPGVDDQAAIASLMKLLEGVPLAIELAAARVRVMPPRTVLQRMSERFKLLASAGGRIGRQSTLRSVFDWSWDLLPLPEKAALAQLSVFEGGFTLESVEAVLDLSLYDDAPWPIDALQSLVHKSLVRPVSDERFDLLVSVQEYATEHLRTPGRYEGSGPEALRAAVARHGACFARLARSRSAARAGIEIDNLVAACRRATERGDAQTATATLEGAWDILKSQGPFKAGLDLVNGVRAIAGLDATDLARAGLVAARVLDTMGREVESHTEFQASLTRAREVGDRRCECIALLGLGFPRTQVHSLDVARDCSERALVMARELDDAALSSDAHNTLGNLELMSGRTGEARAHYEAGLALSRRLGDMHLTCTLLGNLAALCSKMGETDASRSYAEAALAAAREARDRRLEANMLSNLGFWHQLQHHSAEAVDHYEGALAVAREIGHARLECIVLCNLGIHHDTVGQPDEARRHYDAALVVARALADWRSEGQVLGYLGRLYARQSNFVEARRCLESSEALLRAAPDPDSLGITLCSRAESEHLAGDSATAAAALAEAGAIAAKIEAGQDSELGQALARAQRVIGPAAGRESRESAGGQSDLR